jgi:hypothetical protein
MIQVIALPEFGKSLKRLSKKYVSLKQEFGQFLDLTEALGVQGTPLGNGLFKERLAVKSKGKGKSGGLRVISYHDVILTKQDDTVYLVAIYDKSELKTMEEKQINQILKNNGL